MPTIIRDAGIVSPNDLERHTALHAVGWEVQLRSSVWSPPADVYETEEAYFVRVEIPGMKGQDFLISVEKDFLVVSGDRPDAAGSSRRAYHQMEIRNGRFVVAVALPGAVDIEEAEAEYEDGFLTITLPKAAPNHIPVQEGA